MDYTELNGCSDDPDDNDALETDVLPSDHRSVLVLCDGPDNRWSILDPYGCLSRGTYTTQLVTPEPGTLSLFAVGLLGLLSYLWRKKRAA
ncbi:MAG: PEP-CTERM sorting domain-containing protein [Thermoguttaceae bacterium]